MFFVCSVSEVDNDALSALDKQGVAMGCFVLARCLQLGQAVSKSEANWLWTTTKRHIRNCNCLINNPTVGHCDIIVYVVAIYHFLNTFQVVDLCVHAM